MATNKKIILHPIKADGTQDKSTNLNPQTSTECIEGEIKGLHYDTIDKEIPAQIVDGQEYTLPTSYDLSKIDMPSTNNVIYQDNENHIAIGTFSEGSFKVIFVNTDTVKPYYTIQNNAWYNSNEPYTDPITFTYNEDCVLNTKYLDLLKDILGLEPTIVQVDRTLEEKNEDLPNWTFEKKAHTEIVYGFKDETNYKVNFNANDYIDKFPQFYYGNDFYSYNDTYIYPLNVYTSILSITFDEGENSYNFVTDITDTTNYGAWRKSKSRDAEAYTEQELEDVRITIDLSKVDSDYQQYLTKILLDLEGNPITEIEDGVTYKINFNIQDYIDLFDFVYNNAGHSGSFFDVNLYNGYNSYNSIRFLWASVSLNSLYMSIKNPTTHNNSFYYFYPQIGQNYPGKWYSSNGFDLQYRYLDEDLEDVQFNLIRDGIENEELLRAVTLNVDGTPVPEDEEVTIIEKTSLKQVMDTPLKDKTYEQVEKTIEVKEDFIEGNLYYFNADMGFTSQDMTTLFGDISSGDYIYYDEENHISISYQTQGGKGWSNASLVYEDELNSYSYIIADTWNEAMVNEWDSSQPSPIYIHLDCINPLHKEILNKVFELPTHTETYTENITLDSKVNDLPNWKYKEGIYDIPKWDEISPMYDECTVYEQTPDIMISYGFSGISSPIRSFNIYDGISMQQYLICEDEVSYPEVTFKANTWYSAPIGSGKDIPQECDTPQIVLDKQYIIEGCEPLFNSIYGAVTLKETLEKIDTTPLKGKTYDTTKGELKDGESYPLSDNYDEFFNKYGNGQSMFLYGSSEPIVESGVSTRELETGVSTKGGEAILDPNAGEGAITPINDVPIITGIYLYTDSTPTPQPAPDPSPKGGSVSLNDGEITPILVGGASLELITTNGTLNFYQGGTSWEYDGNPVPLQSIPPLILDISLVNPNATDVLKDFLKLSNVSITLEQKFDEVENTPLKDKLYEGSNDLVIANVPDWEAIYNTVYENRGYGEEDTWYYHIYDNRYSDTGIWVCRYETGRDSGIYFQQVNIWNTEETDPEYSEYLIFNIDFYDQELGMEVTANTWYGYNMNENTFEVTTAPTQLVFDRSKINTEETFYTDLFDELMVKSITLEEKLKYLIEDYTEDNGTLTSITVKDKTTGEPITLTVGSGKQYQHNIKMAYHSGETYFCARLTLFTPSNTAMTLTEVRDWLNDNGFKFNVYYTNSYYNCTAYDSASDSWFDGVSADTSINTWNFTRLGGSNVGNSPQFTSSYFNEFEDKVIG